LVIAIIGAAATWAAATGGPDWGTIGHDPTNTRNQQFEHTIDPSNVSQLKLN